MKHKFLKLAGVKTEKEFYEKYPDEASFFKAFPKAKKGLAVTPEQQFVGLNNPMYTEMEFPMQGNNIFRGLDNGQPVLLKDATGKQKILTGPQDTTIMKGTVKEKRIKAQKGTSIDLKKKAIHTVEGRYSGLQGNDSPTLLESIKGNIDYFNNNTPDSNVYRPEFMHHSINEMPIAPVAKHGKSMKGKIPKAQGGFFTRKKKGLITQEQKDEMLWGDQYDNTIPVNPDAQPVQANPNYDPNQQPQFVDQGFGTPIPTSSVKTKFQKTNGKATVDHQQSKNNHPSFGVGEAITSGIGMAQMLMGPEGERRKIDNTLAYNPYAYGTGSQAIAKKGKSIKASHQGQGLMTYEGGNAPKVSENMFDGGTHLFTGDSHEKGGITSSFNGQPFEAEGGEPFAKIEGKGVVFGDLINPVTGRTYKKDAKEIMKKELKITKYLDKGTELVNEKDPTDKFERLAFNAGRAMMEGATTKLRQIADSKAHLAELQEAQLELDGEQAFAKHGKIIKAQSGVTAAPAHDPIELPDLYSNPYEGLVREAARQNLDYDPEIFHRLVTQESGYDPTRESRKNPRTGVNAKGIVMLTPKVAKKYGISQKQLTSTDVNDVRAVLAAGATELDGLLYKYNGDIKLALAAYNGGEGTINHAKKKLGKDNITGDEWLAFQEEDFKKRPSKDPSLWRTQTREYVKNITATDNKEFPTKAKAFNTDFYSIPDFSLPTPQLQGLTPEEIAAMDGKKPNVPNQPAKGSDPFQWQKVEPWKINPTKDKLELSQVMGETAALFDRPDFVEGQSYNPELYTPYQVSFQDRINQNSKTFNALQSTLSGNPEALATMAGQQYSANDAVLAEEFRTNQAISNDITNKNVTLLNDAKLKNISLIDQQYVRQNQAKSITKQNRTNALNSISSKILQKKASNNLLNTYKNMFPHYDFDNNYQVVKQGPGGEQYIIIPTQIGTNPFAATDKKTQTTYENGVEKSKKETIEPTYVRDKKYLELQKQLGDLKFNGSIIKKYKGSN